MKQAERVWVISKTHEDSEGLIAYGVYRSGQAAELGLQRMKAAWPNETFEVVPFRRET